MKAMTFHEIRDTVHSICESVDTDFSDDIPVDQRMDELCHEYWPMWGDVWQAAMGMRFEYFDEWYDTEESMTVLLDGYDTDARLFIIVHECLRLLVRDAYSNGDHLPS